MSKRPWWSTSTISWPAQACGSATRAASLREAFSLAALWLSVVTGKGLIVLHSTATPADLVGLLGYGMATALWAAACYQQRATWCGINLAIFTFAQQLLHGTVDCAKARRQWREAVSLMRVTSRVYQRSFAFLCATTLLVFFATLFDIQQGQAGLESLEDHLESSEIASKSHEIGRTSSKIYRK